MRFGLFKHWLLGLSLALFGGCLYPVRERVDTVIGYLAAQPLDVHTAGSDAGVLKASSVMERAIEPAPQPGRPPPLEISQEPKPGKPAAPNKQPMTIERRLQLPSELPGSRVELKPLSPNATEAERKAYYAKYYPPLPPLPPLPRPQPGPYGHPLTLSELQQLALNNNAALRQAVADVEAAEGAAKQAGAYPNPHFGYQSDNVASGSTAGFQGVFIEQIIKTAGKLKTAQASALMSLLNARVALRRAQSDLITQVRANYFAVLVAEKSLRTNEALAEFSGRLYTLYVDQLIGGQIAGYEPMQLRAFTNQARALAVASRNQYQSAWRQLAASLGLEDKLPLTEVAGSADMPVPTFIHEEVLARVLGEHTEIQTARNMLQKARYDLHSAEITPVPDLDFRVTVQKDFTTPPFNVAGNAQAGIAIPIWDQNRGAIRQAQGALLRASEEERRARTSLISMVADAYQRYASNKAQVEYYRDKVLPDLGLVYSRAVLRYGAQPLPQPQPQAPDTPSLASLDIITHQQIYSAALATYLTALAAQWQAVADLANLLQIDDLYLGVNAPPCQVEECDGEGVKGVTGVRG